MPNLKAAISKLPRFPRAEIQNVGELAEFLSIHRPVSIRDLIGRVDRLRDSVAFRATVVTGAALGGEVELTLKSDGSYTFSGHMRATGFPSFAFNVVAIVRSASGNVTLAAQHSGEVFGTDTSGDRENRWDEVGTDPVQLKQIRNTWPDLDPESGVLR